MKNTGAGYKFTPEELCAVRFPFKPFSLFQGYALGKRAEIEAQWLLETQGYSVRPVTDKRTQLKGIDLVASKGVETYYVDVKAREKSWPHLFVQIAETNHDKRHR